MNYVYIQSEPGLWTVGFYTPDGKWMSESDHPSTEAAAAQVHYLNGGNLSNEPEIAALRQDKAELVKALDRIEFIWTQGSVVQSCPWCKGTRIAGHKEDCPRQAAIANATK